MPKRDARKSSSKNVKRTAGRDSLNVLEQRVVEIAEQLERIAASAQQKADRSFGASVSQSRLKAIRKSASRLLEQLGAKATDSHGDQGRTREQSREKVAAPGKKHRKAPEVLRGVKHSDERISKAMTTERRRSGRPREG
jgi:hypothetical protein